MKNQSRPPLAQIQLTVDVALFTIQEAKLKVLLTKRTNDPYKGFFALPGVFIWEEETSLDSSIRALKDKTGVSVPYVEQLHAFDGLERDPRSRIISVAHYALVPDAMIDIYNLEAGSKLTDVDNIKDLAFDHSEIVEYALKTLREQIVISDIALRLLPEEFTLTDLQTIHEVVLGKKLDKRNFRRNILADGLLKETKNVRKGLQSRPAKLYKSNV